MEKKIKVLVADDSALIRQMLKDMIESEADMEVIDIARNGRQAVEKTLKLNPDVITMDVDMPEMTGLEALRSILAQRPANIIMVSGLTYEGAPQTLEALECGAIDFITKPDYKIAGDLQKLAQEVIPKIRLAAQHNRNKRKSPNQSQNQNQHTATFDKPSPKAPPAVEMVLGATSPKRMLAIGISTGGPQALNDIMPSFPANTPPLVIVQHMPPVFTKSLAERLDSRCQIRVKEAQDGDLLQRGWAYIAPGGHHIRIKNTGGLKKILIDSSPPRNGHKPSVDVLFESIAEQVGADCVAVIMTGMGRDGATGLKLIRDSGGKTIAQDEESSVVYGMPKQAYEEGAAQYICPLDQIVNKALTLLRSAGEEI